VTEAEWLNAIDPQELMRFVQASGTHNGRRCRLFACACVRLIWGLLPHPACREAVEAAEEYADGAAGAERLADALTGLRSLPDRRGWRRSALNAALAVAFEVPEGYDWRRASSAAHAALDAAVQHAGPAEAMRAARREGERAQAALLRDIIGNPFRPRPVVDPAWLSWCGSTVRSLAEAAYQQRELPSGTLDAVRLAVLADALEDAGCSDAQLLSHMRLPGPHVRGCHAVDAVLGKA
jgi:hypothetical protein